MIPRDDDADGRSPDRGTAGGADANVSAPVPFRPAPPLAKRLNRNALTVAAALAGLTVITVLVVTRPGRSGPNEGVPPPGEAPAPVPAHPAFLDQPPKPLPPRESDTARGELGASRGLRTSPAQGAAAGLGAAATPPPGTLDAAAQLPVPPSLSETTSVLPVPGAIASGTREGLAGGSPRYTAYQSALTSSVLVGERAARQAHASESLAVDEDAFAGVPGGSVVVPRPTPPMPSTDSSSGGAAAHGPPTGPSGAAAAPGAVSAAPSSPAAPLPPTVLRLEGAGSPYTIRAGSIIGGFLVTGINSDLPGEVLGQTSRDVYDSETEHVLLVPKGSRLIGTYDSRSVGTGRLIVAWTRLILPDGRSMMLPHLAGTDVEGQAGLHDEVDHHYGRVYGAALLTSAITAGVQLSQPQQSGLYAVPSTREVAAGALGQTMGDVALESARRGLDVPPTIVIRPGQPFDVFLAGDLSFPGPYRGEFIAGGQ
jgi:type IV secretion system protein TrbI